MNKKDIFKICKESGFKKKKSTTMANHNKVIFSKGNRNLIVDSSPYSENAWNVEFCSDHSIIATITSISDLKHCLNFNKN
jgi:hypothetical protein